LSVKITVFPATAVLFDERVSVADMDVTPPYVPVDGDMETTVGLTTGTGE
jgi:hypothetical protein